MTPDQYRIAELANDTKRELQALKTDIVSDKTWREDFKRGLEELKQSLIDTSRNLGVLSNNLDKESALRVQEDKALGDRLTSMSNLFFGLKLGWAALTAILLIVIGVLAGIYIPKILPPTPVATQQLIAPTPPAVAPRTQ